MSANSSSSADDSRRRQGAYHESLIATLKEVRPFQIEDLWRAPDEILHPCLAHACSEEFQHWTTNKEIQRLLHNQERLEQIVKEFSDNSIKIGMFGQQHLEHLNNSNSILVNPTCQGCNNPYDNGSCQHTNSPNLCPVMDPSTNQLTHNTLLILSTINYLLAEEHLNSSNKLILLLAPRQTSLNNPPDRITTISLTPIACALRLMDNCSRAYPKIAHKAAGLMSLVICRSPVSAFTCIDGKAFVISIINYLNEIYRLVHNSECRVEEYFGVIGFLNILPALYHFGNWNEAKSSNQFNVFVAFFVSIIINICHSATYMIQDFDTDDFDAIDDAPRDLTNCPELSNANVLMESLLLVNETDFATSPERPRDWRLQFLHNKPKTFAVMAGLEVLGWWTSRGVDITLATIAASDGSPIQIPAAIANYRDQIRLLIRASPRKEELLSSVEPILKALMKRKKAPLPKPEISLLYGPFIDGNRRCGHCQTTARDVGHDLKRCSGGCGGLEQYCSVEHQKEDWKLHKFACRRNATFKQYTG